MINHIKWDIRRLGADKTAPSYATTTNIKYDGKESNAVYVTLWSEKDTNHRPKYFVYHGWENDDEEWEEIEIGKFSNFTRALIVAENYIRQNWND